MARLRSSRLWLVLLVVAFAVIAKALAYLVVTPESHGFEEQIPVYHEHRGWLLVHITCAALALAGGTLQWILLRRHVPRALHRWTGSVYALSVLVGGSSALPLAAIAFGGIANTVAFGLLALLWVFTTLQAVRAILRGAVASHRMWIVRSFALTLAGISLRVEVGLMQLLGLSFAEAYQIAPWTCWVLNLLAVEWFRAKRPEQFIAPVASATS